jgi:hypothetical protein
VGELSPSRIEPVKAQAEEVQEDIPRRRRGKQHAAKPPEPPPEVEAEETEEAHQLDEMA